MSKSKKKLGRNEPCYCGSGKKFKKCHGSVINRIEPKLRKEDFDLAVKKMEAKEQQRISQQGKGRGIVSTEVNGFRVVAIGSRLSYSKKWRTFHDFLFDYLNDVLGANWGNAELGKKLAHRHPVMKWYDSICHQQRKYFDNKTKVQSAPMLGVFGAYLGLAYNLYLLEHNVVIQELLIRRLQDSNQFFGAYYETYVAACFIAAGFELEMEDEDDPNSTHCEFTAIHPDTGRKFSVEAKARLPGKNHAKISNQLAKALKKDANHERIVFIEVNMPNSPESLDKPGWVSESLNDLKAVEARLTIRGSPAPSCYVILTNNPFWEHLEDSDFGRAAIGAGFKIDDFGNDLSFPSLSAAIEAQEKHKEVDDLFQSIREHSKIPATFDGENPSIAYNPVRNKLTIGDVYLIDISDLGRVPAELTDVTVHGDGSNVSCIYKIGDGRSFIFQDQLSPEEVSAYKEHPDTYFGVEKKQHRSADNALDLYNFFLETYKNTPKDKILEFMRSATDFDSLKELEQTELAKIYCERVAESAMSKRK